MTAVVTPDLYAHALDLGDDELERWYAAQLEAPLHAERAWIERPDALALSALAYTRRGLPVLPVAPGRKRPLGGDCCAGTHRRGCLDATTDPEIVARWWAGHPAANVGIATGYAVDVIDQDGPAGAVSYARALEAGNVPPVLGVVSTPRAGGVHRYVAPTGRGNGAHIAPGLDYRGRGGYVVVPPSTVEGRRYAWLRPLGGAR